MLEIPPPALCADKVRAPYRLRSRSWLCSVQCAAPAVRDRVTAPGSALLRTADPRHRRTQIATYLESCPCTSTYATIVESYSCEKSRGASPPSTSTQLRAARVPHPLVSRVRFFHALPRGGVNLTMPLLRAASLWRAGFTAQSFAVTAGARPGRIRTQEARSQSPLESALAPEQGWGVPPSSRFLQ